MMKPTLARNVHYMEGGRVFAALIIDVRHDEPLEPLVSLVFWDEHGNQNFRPDVAFSKEVAKDDRCWFWPPIPKPSVEELEKFKNEMAGKVTTVTRK